MSTKLVLLRHGQSTWNLENRFTGWHDVPLTETGLAEARAAGKLLALGGHAIDRVHVSLLRRALQTMNLALEELERLWVPVAKHWRLNERHYGALQGLDKKAMTEKFGAEQVHLWRRSYDVPPPPLTDDDPQHPRKDPRYASLAPDLLPATECLKDVVARMLPYWHDAIVPDIRAGSRVLVVAHGNSLRALVKHLDGISDAAIAELNIPTGIPLIYELDDELRPVGAPGPGGVRGTYLGDPEAAARAAAAVANQSKV